MSDERDRGRLRIDEDQARDVYVLLRDEHHRRHEMYVNSRVRFLEAPNDITEEAMVRYRGAVRRVERTRKQLLELIREKGWQEP